MSPISGGGGGSTPTGAAGGVLSGTYPNPGIVALPIADLADPTTGKVIGSAASAAAAVFPPGFEIGYNAISSPVTVSSTTEATGTTIITASAYTFDGAAVYVEFYCCRAIAGSAGVVTISLFESSTQITRLAEVGGVSGAQACVLARYKFTPTAAAHTYTVTAFSPQSASVQAGAGGTATDAPAYVRFVKA